jgi:Single-strand binding protein family/Phage integrase, N-terminal SAM-like domain
MGYGPAMTPDYAPSLLRSFERHLRAENRSDNTVESYLESIRQAEAFLAARGRTLLDARRVMVVGQLRARSWETPEGERRSVVEVQAEEVGPSLRWATAKPERATGNGSAKGRGEFNDDPPF